MRFEVLMLLVATAWSAAWAQDASLLQRYGSPKDSVGLPGGRKLHLVCMGQGSPTVILTAGLGDWSEIWSKVQPAIAARTRSCAWDRAGLGFSDASRLPQTVVTTTNDLEDALAARGVNGPYIVVGHSMGSYESLRFADRNRSKVRGMVLVDPSVPDQFGRFAKAAPAYQAFLERRNASEIEQSEKCAADLRSGALSSAENDAAGCLRYAPRYPPELAAALAKLDMDPARFDTVASLLRAFGQNSRLMIDHRRNYGNMPLIVLTAMVPVALPSDAGPAVRTQAAAWQREWRASHSDIAALSTRGANWHVLGSGHYVQITNPDAVIAAIGAVLDAQSR